MESWQNCDDNWLGKKYINNGILLRHFRENDLYLYI